MKYIYYPGCSLKSTSRHYEESLLITFEKLGIEMEELDDWSCCGATAYMSINELDAFALASRNLALAKRAGDDVNIVAPCSGCYVVLRKTKDYMQAYPHIKDKVKSALAAAGLEYDFSNIAVRHPLDVLVNDYGVDKIKENVRGKLNFKVASYYGCQTVRPYGFDHPHQPSSMDELMRVVGAKPVEWPAKSRCCGSSLTGTVGDVGLRLNYLILKEAKRRGADVIVTACPFCQFNLECFQNDIARKYDDVAIPVMPFTQLVGMALGISESELGVERLFVRLK